MEVSAIFGSYLNECYALMVSTRQEGLCVMYVCAADFTVRINVIFHLIVCLKILIKL